MRDGGALVLDQAACTCLATVQLKPTSSQTIAVQIIVVRFARGQLPVVRRQAAASSM
jgi:hypothetical protein